MPSVTADFHLLLALMGSSQRQLSRLALLAASCCLFAVVSNTLPQVWSASPRRVRLGALFDLNSSIGREISTALHLALLDVNQAGDLFNGTQFDLEIADSACDPIQGAASAVELVKKEVVIILGPQSSAVAPFVAHIGKAAQVPILSFGATDPNLAERQYSYFFRILPSDVMQMEAVATLVAGFKWKEVVMIFTDDDYGTNGASALRHSLQIRGSRLIAVSKFNSDPSQDEIRAQLRNLDDNQVKVFVLHTPRNLGLKILSQANDLNMLRSDYVWIVTNLIASGELMPDPDLGEVQSFKGLLGTRRFIPQSPSYEDLMKKWREEYPRDLQTFISGQPNTYAVYAYDALHAAALAISSHLAQRRNLTFKKFYKMHKGFAGKSDFQQMKILESGSELRQSLRDTTFLGASGLIQFDDEGGRENAAFEYINLAGMGLSVVAYWAHGKNVSILPTQLSNKITIDSISQGLNFTSFNITWPGGSTEIPRGWLPTKDGKSLKIGVPKKGGYKELVRQTTDSNNETIFDGFCIAVFETAVKQLHYGVSYEFVPMASNIVGQINPHYDDLIDKVANGDLDAAVGDITVTSERLSLVDFTQPYIESGLVVLVKKLDKHNSNPWAFLQPFTATMWLTIIASMMFTGIVIWILEHQQNKDWGGSPKRQVGIVVWFMFSTFFVAHRESTKSCLARIVVILWLFVALILNSSYTASLTAILTVEQLRPEIQGLDSLLRLHEPIGFQTGSFVQKYLIGQGVHPNLLKDLDSLEDYKAALDLGPRKGGVAAIVDELPYIEIFLAADCKHYAIAGPVFTKSGWGFAFPRGSPLAEDLSSEILKMSQTGRLSQAQSCWIREGQCTDASVKEQASQLGIRRFWALFLIMGATSIACVLGFMVQKSRASNPFALCALHSIRGEGHNSCILSSS